MAEFFFGYDVVLPSVSPFVFSFHFRQQKQQYTNQLAKETDKYIKEFGSLPTTPSEQVRGFQMRVLMS